MPKPTKEITEVGILIEIDPAAPDFESASDRLSKAIGTLLANEAMEYPVHVSVLAANGSGCLIRYSQTGEVSFLAEHMEPKGMRLPIHATVMDREGYTARIVIRQKTMTAN